MTSPTHLGNMDDSNDGSGADVVDGDHKPDLVKLAQNAIIKQVSCLLIPTTIIINVTSLASLTPTSASHHPPLSHTHRRKQWLLMQVMIMTRLIIKSHVNHMK